MISLQAEPPPWKKLASLMCTLPYREHLYLDEMFYSFLCMGFSGDLLKFAFSSKPFSENTEHMTNLSMSY